MSGSLWSVVRKRASGMPWFCMYFSMQSSWYLSSLSVPEPRSSHSSLSSISAISILFCCVLFLLNLLLYLGILSSFSVF